MRFRLRVKVAITLLFVALAIPVALGCVGYLKHYEESTVPEEVQLPDNAANRGDTIEEAITELPSIENVSPEEEPLLYDFLAGCLDWHVPIYRDSIDSDLYILRHKSSPQILYTDWYMVQGGYTVPPTGTVIETLTLHSRDVARFDTLLTMIPSEYIIEDGDWQMIIYAGDAAIKLNSLGIVFRDSHKYAEGRVPPFITDGTGWPTELLRREPYATRLASESDIDMQDSWWDTFRLNGRYDIVESPGVPLDHQYYAICTGVRQFSFCDEEGNVARGMSWDLLRTTCNQLLANISGIYTCNSWSAEEE